MQVPHLCSQAKHLYYSKTLTESLAGSGHHNDNNKNLSQDDHSFASCLGATCSEQIARMLEPISKGHRSHRSPWNLYSVEERNG